MCGIAGYLGFKDDSLIKKMSQDLRHRGPDGEGFFLEDQVSLLNRRLSIIDIQGGNQPIYNEDLTLVVVYNGEIYNYLELKKALETFGHIFSTNSDTEVILHGYEQWGLGCFDKLNGMFGIALYDIKKKELILARDHFGIKPLYFSIISHEPLKLIFSSEIRPILNSNLIKRGVNERILYRYLKFRIHDDQRETFFEGVSRLLPGELAVIKSSSIEIKTYSSLEKDLHHLSSKSSGDYRNITDQELNRFRELLTKSIQDRLMSEVPVGSALSGGLDSSTVVSVVNKIIEEEVQDSKSKVSKQKTFSAVFPGSSNDEEKYIDALIDKCELIEPFKVYPKPEDFFADLVDFVKTQEEPTISTGPYAQYQVMKKASQEVKVLLDGQGADEMMAGYLPYYFVYFKQLYLSKNFSLLISEIWNSHDILLKFFWIHFLQKIGINKSIPINSVLNPSFLNRFQSEKFNAISDKLKSRLIQDLFKNSLQPLLRYEDRNTMRFSIEGRVPFLDFELVRFLFKLPDTAIIKNGWNKYILREAVKDISGWSKFPPMIRQRRNKIGFTTPEKEWFLKMKNRIYYIFMSESFISRPYFNQKEIVKSFREFIEGKNSDTMLFWRMLNVELWLREFFDEKKEPKITKKWVFGSPNEGKELQIKTDEGIFDRYPIKTDLVDQNTEIVEFVSQNVLKNISSDFHQKKPWYVVVSEKIVAISQGRSYFIWDIKPSFWAKILSKFVTKTPHGIGLGSPWTMQIAINEAGLPLILIASLCSIITKPFGLKGIFYYVVGHEISAIDGPTEYSIFPSNVSAKLSPKNPDEVAKNIELGIRTGLDPQKQEFFGGVVIIDANDLGRKVLGNSTRYSNELFEQAFSDNPMGQSDEQTPLVILSKD